MVGSSCSWMLVNWRRKSISNRQTTQIVLCFRQYFPGFSQDLDNYEYYGRLPAPCDGHIYDQGINDALAKYFDAKSVCVLHGVSGSGKTQAAIGFVRQRFKWIRKLCLDLRQGLDKGHSSQCDSKIPWRCTRRHRWPIQRQQDHSSH